MSDLIQIQAINEYQELCMLVKNDIRSVFRKGQLLKNLRDTESYKRLGDGGYQTFNEFLSDPTLKMSRSYAFQHIQMYDFYIEDLKLSVDELSKVASIKLLRDCMSFILTRNLSDSDALIVIEKAKVLSYGDFFKEVTGQEIDKLLVGQVQLPDTISKKEKGYFYIFQLVPEYSPEIIKLGFTTDIGRRLLAHKTTNPSLILLGKWSCKAIWERTAIDSVTRLMCKPISNSEEVFDCKNIVGLLRRTNEFFNILPK